MKKNHLFSVLLAAAMVTSCASDRSSSEPTVSSNTGQGSGNDSIPVMFEGYQSRNVTRSGWAGVLDLDQLKETEANGGGFGVFAYYTDLKKYDRTYVPNFMYNQGVFWNSTTGIWEYSPIMYWPNEYGFDASSDDEDHVTFFAYAPFAENASPAAGSVDDASYGITGFSRNNATGDPMVKYIASFEPSKSVDLCWGVVPSDKTSWAKIQNGSTQTLAEGLPWLDVERPMEAATQVGATSSSRIKFKFNHALAQLNVQIDTDADITTHTTGVDALGTETKVYVRSISFTGIALKGALNLNNTTPNQALWLDYSCTTDLAFGQSVTVHDGRRDSREGVLGAEASNETPSGLNPNIIQNSTPTDGVTHEYQNLFKPTSSDPAVALEEAVCVIPTGEAMTITIVYDVETINPDLTTYISDGATHGMSIENRITKTVSFNNVAGAGLESNKRYALKLHLGMNSVKFDAEVQDWVSTTVNGEGWLPSNTRPIVLSQSVMYLGAPQVLTATTNPLGQAVAWENTDNSIASIPSVAPFTTRGTRSSESIALGVTPAVKVSPVALGTTTVIASLASGEKATCTVHVVPVTITSVRSSDSKTKGPAIAINDTILKTFTATLTPDCFGAPATPPVSWTVVPATGVVSLAVNPSTGVCTVTGTGVGSAVVTCTNTGYTSQPATYTIEVEEQAPTVTAPTAAAGWTYDAAAHDLFATAGSATGGTLKYSIDNSNWYTNYQDAAVQATNAGTYPLYYKVEGNPGYADIPSTSIGSVVVAKKTPTITLSATSGTGYAMGVPTTFTATLDAGAVTDGSTLNVNSNNGTATISTGTVTSQGATAGTATVTVSSTATTNYNAASATFTLTVNAKTASLNPLSNIAGTNISSSNDGAATSTATGPDGSGLYNFSQLSAIATANPGYHVPSSAEWFGIIPADWTSGYQSIYSFSGNRMINGVEICSSGGVCTTLNDVSNWDNSGGTSEVYAVRFVGTDYCSVWKYSYTGTSLVISSEPIDYIANQSGAATWLAANKGSLSFSGSTAKTINLSANGYCGAGSSVVSNGGTYGHYWSITGSGSNAWFSAFNPSVAHLNVENNLGSSYSVRLFSD